MLQYFDDYRDVPKDELEQIAEDPDKVLEIFQKNMQIGKVSNRLKYDAQDHLEKCEGIKKLQKNI